MVIVIIDLSMWQQHMSNKIWFWGKCMNLFAIMQVGIISSLQSWKFTYTSHREFWLWNDTYMSLEKICFALWIRRRLGKKEFFKSYCVLLRAELNCTKYASQTSRLAGSSLVATGKANVRFQKFFFTCLCIHL